MDLQNSLLESNGHVAAAIVFIIVYTILPLLKNILVNRLRRLSVKTASDLDDVIVSAFDQLGWPLYLFIAAYSALSFTQAPSFAGEVVFYAFIAVATYYAVRIIQSFISYGSGKIIEKRLAEEKDSDVSLIHALTRILNATLWVIAGLLILDNFGYNISALLAGLGVGGIAIALALQNVLEDVFSSLSIYFDKPFKVGDFIVVGDDLGTVKKIGIKTTRLQHLQGHELVISNRELTSTRINNYGKMEKRRVSFSFGVTYDTTVENLKIIPRLVKKVIEDVEKTEFARTHFKSLGDSSLNYEVVYFADTSDYAVYMDIQQAINLGIITSLNKHGIQFAYPTQTLYLKK